MGASTSAPAESSNSECLSVMALFDHFEHIYGDIRSIDTSNATVCCDMEGVTCANNKVVSIKLNSKDLHGSLPDSIKDLKSLETLDLSGNQIFGSIPSFFGGLTQLKSL